MGWRETRDAPCSIARALGVVGERWTLLILREIFQGSGRFDDLRGSLGISRNVLSQRLEALVGNGVLEKVLYQDRPVRFEYRLTEKGRDLYSVVVSMTRWGDRWMAGDAGKPVELVHIDCGKVMHPELGCPECGVTLRVLSVNPIDLDVAEEEVREWRDQ